MTLKDEYKKDAKLFGGNEGEVIYKIWVKTLIDKKDINYATNQADTDLTDLSLGFVSTSGNTADCPIIQTKSKDGSTHNAELMTELNDKLIDYQNSYYVQGTVDNVNNFTESGSKQTLSTSLTIKTDGTYHLHLVDTVGNTYDSYLELGKDNWKLKGTFKNDELDRLKTKLNVTVNLKDPNQLAQATGGLTNYDKFATDVFKKSVQANGKGFDAEIKADKKNDFKWFLKPLTFEPNHEPKFTDGIDKGQLDKTIKDTAEKFLQDGLSGLPQDLNVDTSNVVNKSTLDSYSNWINSYNNFINDNKKVWFNQISANASRGFATSTETQQIKDYLNGLNFSKYLKRVVWTPTTVLSTSSDYKEFV